MFSSGSRSPYCIAAHQCFRPADLGDPVISNIGNKNPVSGQFRPFIHRHLLPYRFPYPDESSFTFSCLKENATDNVLTSPAPTGTVPRYRKKSSRTTGRHHRRTGRFCGFGLARTWKTGKQKAGQPICPPDTSRASDRAFLIPRRRYRFSRCFMTVWKWIPSSRAICLQLLPAAIRTATCFCLSVSPTNPVAERLFFFASHPTGQLDHTGCPRFVHQAGTVFFDRAGTDTQMKRDLLATDAFHRKIENFLLARGQKQSFLHDFPPCHCRWWKIPKRIFTGKTIMQGRIYICI
nr:MAG TPA: hypothetical protein [Caudoviricetes sp.]